MRPPIPRFVLWTIALAMIAALSVAVFQYWGGSQYRTTAGQDNGWTQTRWGPLGPADRDLLIKVREAGLWEGPTGQDAQQRATSVRVREAGRLIAAEHADLDARVREVSAQLGVPLPNQPSDQQKGWITELTSQSGPDFDRAFVQRLRTAHGNVLPIISQVRAGTRNDLVRQFATTSAQFVTRHHEYLERTGLVDYAALPEPPAPAAAPPSVTAPLRPAAPPVAAAPLRPAAPPAAAAPLRPAAPPVAAAPLRPAAPPAEATTPPAAVAPAAAEHGQHLAQVASVTPVNGAPVMIAAMVYIAALLAVVGLLWLLGTAGLRARRARPGPQRGSFDQPGRPRHAAQRW